MIVRVVRFGDAGSVHNLGWRGISAHLRKKMLKNQNFNDFSTFFSQKIPFSTENKFSRILHTHCRVVETERKSHNIYQSSGYLSKNVFPHFHKYSKFFVRFKLKFNEHSLPNKRFQWLETVPIQLFLINQVPRKLYHSIRNRGHKNLFNFLEENSSANSFQEFFVKLFALATLPQIYLYLWTHEQTNATKLSFTHH